MVKVRDFKGAVFHPDNYQKYLSNNIEHLQMTPMSKTFNSQHFLQNGELQQDPQPAFYIYHQNYNGHSSYGILAEISLEDYHTNKIKKHQKTLVRPGMNADTYAKDHVGPVVVSYRQNNQLDQLIRESIKQKEAFSEWTTNDARKHKLWKIKNSQFNLTERFNQIDSLYILDGHHRLQAAHENYLSHPDISEDHSFKWIQAIIYSSADIVIHPQHRVFEQIQGNIIEEIMTMEEVEVTQLEEEEEEKYKYKVGYEIIVASKGKHYGINFKNECRNVLEKVPAFRLQTQLLTALLNESNAPHLKFIPGITPPESTEYPLIFYLLPPRIETLFQIADQSVTMPPKSTWIEPKPCSHMVIRVFQ